MPQRHPMRLPQYDYSSIGAYFVTTCAFQRRNIFGDIVSGEMRLNNLGEIVRKTWNDLLLRFPSIELDEWVIMPNHVHGIISILDRPDSVGAGFPRPPAGRRDPDQDMPETERGATETERGGETPPLRKETLGQMMAYFKYVSTKNINGRFGRPGQRLWQRGYYEHVIRDDADLVRIRRYIAENPMKWASDTENVGSHGYAPSDRVNAD